MAGRRRIIGVAGAPGVGKTTYAAALVADALAAGVPAVHVPMDGFHLADLTLTALGRLDRKGAPDTFDAWGYAALLARLRAETDHVVYCPGFERELEQPIAGVVAVPPRPSWWSPRATTCCWTGPEWVAVRAELDEVVFLEADDDLRRARLVARHVAFGKTPAEAEAWVTRVDDPNARLVAATRERADRVVDPADLRPSLGAPD